MCRSTLTTFKLASALALLTIGLLHDVAAAPPSSIKHVLLLVEENHSYSEVIGNVNEMPYLNSLASTGGLATNYYGVTHPSIGNYFELTTGQIITNNDG